MRNNNSKTKRKSRIGRAAPSIVKRPSQQRDEVAEGIKESELLKKILDFAKTGGDAGLIERYEAIIGTEPHAVLLASNQVHQHHISKAVHLGLRRMAKLEGFQLAFQAESMGRIPASSLVIPLKSAKARSKVYARAGASSISVLDFLDVPMPDDSSGWGIELRVISLIFGVNISSDVMMAQRQARMGRSDPVCSLDWVDATSKRALREAVERVLMPPLVGSEESREAARLAQCDDVWMKKKRAQQRAWVMLHLLSMLPMARRFSAQGAGRQILEPAVRQAVVQTNEAARGRRTAIHPDGVPHFWFHELRRLGFEDIGMGMLMLR